MGDILNLAGNFGPCGDPERGFTCTYTDPYLRFALEGFLIGSKLEE
jgi:hypothetical protein